jgi:hypothetical protein
MHPMPDGSMMEGEMEDMPSMLAGDQASALEALPDASIKAMEKQLAAKGASMAQPRTSGSMIHDEMEPPQDSYAEVEPDAREDF